MALCAILRLVYKYARAISIRQYTDGQNDKLFTSRCPKQDTRTLSARSSNEGKNQLKIEEIPKCLVDRSLETEKKNS